MIQIQMTKRVERGVSVLNIDAFLKSRKMPFSVIPAKAGIQEKQALLDPGFRRGDGFDDFLRTHQNCEISTSLSQQSQSAGSSKVFRNETRLYGRRVHH